MKEFGTVISTMDGPSTRKFSFVIKKNKVSRGEFVEIPTEEGKLIGSVSDIFRSNRYFDRPDSVKEYESSGKGMADIFPVADWEYLVAEVRPLGVFNEKGFHDALLPPSPGSTVVEPEAQLLKKFFGMDDNGLHLGLFMGRDIEVKLNATRLIQKHLAILAMSGAGKSYLTSVLLEELMSRKPEESIAVIVVDPHGEYRSFSEDPAFAGKVRIFESSDIKVGLPGVRHSSLAEFVPKLSGAQARQIGKIMSGLGGEYGIKDVMSRIESEVKSATKDVLLSTMADLGELRVFGKADSPPVSSIARQGQLSVLDLSATTNLRKKQIITAHIARKLFNLRKAGKIPPFLLILEEAHQFCPEKKVAEQALSKGIIITMAREGRKFHANLCLISQRPVNLSTTALSQCNTHIILRITNPYDLEHIEKSSEGITRDVMRQVSGLKVGNGLVVGEGVNFPLFIRVRKRNSRPSAKGLPLEEAAREFYMSQQKLKADAKAFM